MTSEVTEVSEVVDLRSDPFTEEQRRAWEAFLSAGSKVLGALESELSEVSRLSLGEYLVLSHLYRSGGSMRMSQLAENVNASRSGLTRRIDRLSKQGYVERASVAEDKRGAQAVLTEAGQDVLESIRPYYSKSVKARFLDVLTDEQMQGLTAALEAIAEKG